MARGSYLPARRYVPSKRVKAAHKAFNAREDSVAYCSLKTFAAFERGDSGEVCRDWFGNKQVGGRGLRKYSAKASRGLR